MRSFAEARIHLNPDVNVIIGPSDSGKSNLVRACKSVAQNDSMGAMARTGMDHEKEYVWAELGFGSYRVALHKETPSKTNTYKILYPKASGKQRRAFTQVGSGVPEQISELLNMGPVSLAGELVNLNIASQRGSVFGVDDSPLRLGRVIGAVSGLDVIFRAVRRADKQKREQVVRAKVLLDEFKDSRDRYRKLKDSLKLDELDTAVKQMRELELIGGGNLEQSVLIEYGIERVLIAASTFQANQKRSNAVAGVEFELRESFKKVQELCSAAHQIDELLGEAEEAARDVIARVQLVDGLIERESWERAEFDKAIREAGDCPLCGRK